MAVGGRLVWNQAALDELLTSTPGPVGRLLQRDAERVTQEAKRLAPTSPHGSHGRPSGYGRSAIGWTMGADGEGLYADISTPATSPAGFPYMALQEVGGRYITAQPHLRPALDILR